MVPFVNTILKIFHCLNYMITVAAYTMDSGIRTHNSCNEITTKANTADVSKGYRPNVSRHRIKKIVSCIILAHGVGRTEFILLRSCVIIVQSN